MVYTVSHKYYARIHTWSMEKLPQWSNIRRLFICLCTYCTSPFNYQECEHAKIIIMSLFVSLYTTHKDMLTQFVHNLPLRIPQ